MSELVLGCLEPAIKARGDVRAEVVDARTGRVLREIQRRNLVVNGGLNLLRDLMAGDGVAPTHGAVGTNGAVTAATDTSLGGEVFRDLIASRTKGTHSLVIKFVVGSQSANGQTLREAGLFNAASAGTMYARATFSDVAKTDSILVIYTWTLTFGAA